MKRVVIVLSLLVFSTTVSASIFDGIVAHYRLEQDATDYYGNYNGSGPVNGAIYNHAHIGYGVQFDGVNDYYEFADFNPRGVGGSYSVSLWVQPFFSSTPNPYHIFIGKHQAQGQNLFLFGHDLINDRMWVYIRGERLTCYSIPEFYEWTHFVAIMEEVSTSTYVTLYRNGEILCQGLVNAQIGTTTGKKWLIGADWDYNSGNPSQPTMGTDDDWLFGKIDEVIFYNRALTETEVRDLTVYPLLEGNNIAKYDFEDNLYDAYGNFDGAGLGGSGTTYSEGHQAKAIFFPGSGYANLGTFDPRAYYSDMYSISFWVKTEYDTSTAIPSHSYIALHDTSGNNLFVMGRYYNDNDLNVTIRNRQTGVSADVRIDSVEPQGAWTHYVVSCLEKPSQGKTYVTVFMNGAYLYAGTINSTLGNLGTLQSPNHWPWIIGMEWDGPSTPSDWLAGKIDHIRFYNRQISENEAVELYRYDDGMRYCSHANLEGTCRTSRDMDFDLGNNYWWVKVWDQYHITYTWQKRTVNDDISSVHLSNEWEAYVCQHSNHNGSCQYIAGETYGNTINLSISGYAIDNNVSSFTIQPMSFEKAREYYGYREIGENGYAPQAFAYLYEHSNYAQPTYTNDYRRLFLDSAWNYQLPNLADYIMKPDMTSSVELFGSAYMVLLDNSNNEKKLKTSHHDFLDNIVWSDVGIYDSFDFRTYNDNVKGAWLIGEDYTGSIGWFVASDVSDPGHATKVGFNASVDLDEVRIEVVRDDIISYPWGVISTQTLYSRLTDYQNSRKEFEIYGDNYDLIFLGAHGSFGWSDAGTQYTGDDNWNVVINIIAGDSPYDIESGVNSLNRGRWMDIVGTINTDWVLTSACNSMGRDHSEGFPPQYTYDPINPNVINAWKYPLERLHGAGGFRDESWWGGYYEDYEYYNFWNDLQTKPVSEAWVDSFSTQNTLLDPDPVRAARFLTREDCDCTNTSICTSYMYHDYFHGMGTILPDKENLDDYDYFCYRSNGGDTSYYVPMLLVFSPQLVTVNNYPETYNTYQETAIDENEVIFALGLDSEKTYTKRIGEKIDREKLKEGKEHFLKIKSLGFEMTVIREIVPIGGKEAATEAEIAHKEEATKLAQKLTSLSINLDKVYKEEVTSYRSVTEGTYEETGSTINRLNYVFSASVDGHPLYKRMIEVEYDGEGLYKVRSNIPKNVTELDTVETIASERLEHEIENRHLTSEQKEKGKVMYVSDKDGVMRLVYLYPDYEERKTKAIEITE